VIGAAGNLIEFRGSTNFAAGGTVFTGTVANLTISGRYLGISDIQSVGGFEGFTLSGAHHCEFYNIRAISNLVSGINMPVVSHTNTFRRCLSYGSANALRITVGTIFQGNYFENSILISSSMPLYLNTLNLSNIVGCIIGGPSIFIQDSFIPARGERNIFFGMNTVAADLETMPTCSGAGRAGWATRLPTPCSSTPTRWISTC
jgi:hypothetical protein